MDTDKLLKAIQILIKEELKEQLPALIKESVQKEVKRLLSEGKQPVQPKNTGLSMAKAMMDDEVIEESVASKVVSTKQFSKNPMINQILNETAMEALARKTLDGLSVRTVKSIRQTVSSLSGGQRQTVAIARAVLWNSKVVILDEPTAALGVAQTEQVLNLVRRLADNGLAVVLISHNLNDVFEVADNIAALYLGNMAAQVNKNEVIPRQVIELITTGKSAGVEAPTANTGATK